MPNDFSNRSQPQTSAWPNSADSLGFFVMKELYDQTGMLGEISAKVDRLPEVERLAHRNAGRLDRLETKFDAHLKDCQPRRKLISIDSLKENWTVFLLAFQLGVFLLLQMLGQPDKAQQVWATSPAFQRGERDADSP